MSNERGDFKGGDTITVGEIRVDNADVIVLPHSATVHRTPPAIPYSKVEWGGTELYGTLQQWPEEA